MGDRMNVDAAASLAPGSGVGELALATPAPQLAAPDRVVEALSVPGLTKLSVSLFLQGKGAPVTSGRGVIVTKLTSQILIDVCDVVKKLFSTRSGEVKASCGGLKEAEARGYMLAELLGVFEQVFDDTAEAAGKLAATRAGLAKERARVHSRSRRQLGLGIRCCPPFPTESPGGCSVRRTARLHTSPPPTRAIRTCACAASCESLAWPAVVPGTVLTKFGELPLMYE